MTVRAAVLLAALAVPAVVVPAHAGKAPICRQISDGTGDASITGSEPSHDPIDIVSGDIATGSRNLVAVIRLKSLAADPALSGGTTYSFGWSAGKVAQMVSLIRTADGTQIKTFDPDAGNGVTTDTRDVNVAIDANLGTITFTVPRATNPALRARGVKFTNLALEAAPAVNLNVSAPNVGSFSFATALPGDSAATGRSYVDGTPTCVKGV